MRVYLPKEIELLEVTGNSEPLEIKPIPYNKKGFEKDQLLNQLESNAIQDTEKHINYWIESDKLVIGSWLNVNPKQTGKIIYKYRLPFKIDNNTQYSLLVQKQSGIDSMFEFNMKIDPQFPFKSQSNSINQELMLNSDLNISFDFKPIND